MKDYGQDLIIFLACVLMSFALASSVWTIAQLVFKFGLPR